MATSPSTLKLAKGVVVSIRDLGLNEDFIEKFIEDDPTVLGLGDDISVIESQRRQDKGRLDLLLQDGAQEQRYEVELMLGNVDESHLIRTIEYWDVERRTYPGYEHCAVLVAENVTARFLNVITLFSGSIPIIALQMSAIKVEGAVGLTFVRVIDSRKLRRDDTIGVTATKSSDRAAWVTFAGEAIIGLVDTALGFINKVAKHQRTLNYNKQFIGLMENGTANNFVYFSPNKASLWIKIGLDPADAWIERVESAGLEKRTDDGVRIKVTPKTFADNQDLIREMLEAAVTEDEV